MRNAYSMTDNGFPKQARLLRGSEFEQVFKARVSASDARLLIHGAKNDLERPRLGLAVSRRYGSAVARNRWKRVLRAAFRSVQQDLSALDLVCIPRGQAEPDMRQMARSLQALAARIEDKLKRGHAESPHQRGPRRKKS
jgi:ribonuclease P protein component